MKKSNKGFTLIELLAVIIILGILMIIAIPSVTSYISDSRKNAYVDTAKEIISGARNLVNDGKLEMFDTGTTYYIDAACIKTENGIAKSPYGEFTKAYIVVIYDGKGYEYYWTSVDDAGQGIKEIVKNDLLDSDQIESDLKDTDITTTRGVDGRSTIQIISSENGCKKEEGGTASTFVSANGDSTGAIMYPTGKGEDGLEIGDLVRIGDQDFYFVKYYNGHKVLIARYNLKIGYYADVNNGRVTNIKTYSTSDSGYGLQSSEAIGVNNEDTKITGTMAFSSSNYWNGQLGEGGTYSDRYVYNSNSKIHPYIENYKRYIESLGVTVYDARLIRWDEVTLFSGNLYSYISNTSFWTGTASTIDAGYILCVFAGNRSGSSPYSSSYYVGVKPVIVL